MLVGFGLIGSAVISAYMRSQAPLHESVWRPAPEPTPISPTAVPEEDKVINASAPLRLELPTIGFDSAALVPEGQSNPILEWTQAMDDANGGFVRPPDPWESSMVYDSTVAGGGLPGTNVATTPRILAHTSPWEEPVLGAFNFLPDLKIGDPAAITTAEGRLCYKVIATETVLKDLLNVVFDKKEVRPGIVLAISCNRPEDLKGWFATTENRVVTLQLDQQATNAGGCSW